MNSRATMWQVGIAVVVVLAAISFFYYIKNPPAGAPIRVAIMTWGGAGPGFVGLQKGCFGQQAISFDVLDDSRARQAAYQSKDFELLLTNPDQHQRELEMGLPGRLVLLSDVSLGADGVVARSEIRTIKDLKGKQVVYVQGAASDLMISRALESAGLSRTDVRLRAVDDPSVSMASLRSGAIAAAVSWEPTMSEATKDGTLRILFTSKDVPDTILGAFVAKESLIESEARLNTFISGWLCSVKYVKDYPSDSLSIMARAFSVSTEQMQGMMSGLALVDAKGNLSWFDSTAGTSRLDTFVEDTAKYWHKNGLLKNLSSPGSRWTAPQAEAIIRKHVADAK